MRSIAAVLSILLCLATTVARAAHTDVQLLLSADTAKAGAAIYAGVDMKMEPGWHTYWKNPGEAGIATQIKWQLPPDISAGQIQWPLPDKIPPAEVTTYGYEHEVLLIVPLKLAADLKPGPLDLKAHVTWLECKGSCIPASADVEATLTIGNETKISANAATIDSWQKKVPLPADQFFSIQAWWSHTATDDTRPFMVQLTPRGNVKTGSVDFYPAASQNYEIQPATKTLPTANGIFFKKSVQKFSGDWPKEISGVIVLSNQNSRVGYETKFPVASHAPAGATVSAARESGSGSRPVGQNRTPALPLMLLYAFIGGLILNIMPCVLPVIALKILGFVSEARSEPRRVRLLGGIYTLGVLFSFLVLAAIVIGVKAAGHQAGWGMQFGSPVFVVCLCTLVTLVALNLFGVFEVILGGRALSAAGELASRHGAPGAFFNGVLATALATPCTAPFLGAALGFAFLQPPAIILLVFLFVGLGLAAPYLVLSWNPAWLKFLPKPGPWMEKFKIAMGFPMLATVVWLFNLAYDDYGKNVLWLGLFLVTVALAAWVFGEFFQRGRRRRGIALAITLILLGSSYMFALEKELNWREATPPASSTNMLTESSDGLDWQPWSPAAVAKAQAAGHPVLVDFTADWCLTCQVNKKTSIENSAVRKKLKDLNAVTLVGDYTHFPPAITTELNHFNRAGVPLVLVYPKGPDTQPIVLPEVLTPGIVLAALDRAGG